jgi:hypothetical protein
MSDVGRVGYAIMAHPGRRKLIPSLQRQLPDDTAVVWDKLNDRWDTGRRALLAYDPEDDWHVVIQDDAILCKDFAQGVQEALRAVPRVPVSFYTGKTRPYAEEVSRAVNGAIAHGKRWIAMRGPIWGVGVAIPSNLIVGMVEACDRSEHPNYDMRMGEYFTGIGMRCWYSVPSLVNHRVGKQHPSLVPGRGSGPKRVAHQWIGDDSPLDINWMTGSFRAMDPSEPWLRHVNGYECQACPKITETLGRMLAHQGVEHEMGMIDFVASTPMMVHAMSRAYMELPERQRGTLFVVGKYRCQVPHKRVRPAEALRKISRGPRRFTIVDSTKHMRLIGDRTGWAWDGHGN